MENTIKSYHPQVFSFRKKSICFEYDPLENWNYESLNENKTHVHDKIKEKSRKIMKIYL